MTKYLFSFGLALMLSSLQAQTSGTQYETPNPEHGHPQWWRNTSPSDRSNPERSVDSQQWNQSSRWNSEHPMQNPKAKASDSVNAMLSQVQRAQTALDENRLQFAKQDVNNALQTADQLGRVSTGLSPLIPLYTELGEYTVIGPPRQNQRHEMAMRGSANQSYGNNTDQANTRGNIAVNRVIGEYTSVAFDMKTAKDHLEAAQRALDRGDTQAARDALAAVQNSVIVHSYDSDMPLLRARENLMLARAAVSQGNYTEAHSALQAVSRSLANYEQLRNNHLNEVKNLRSEIDNYNQSIAQNHADASSKIESWWNRLTDLNTPVTASSRSTNSVR
jgi:predicted negative regulator of RcsB-dependent stress response